MLVRWIGLDWIEVDWTVGVAYAYITLHGATYTCSVGILYVVWLELELEWVWRVLDLGEWCGVSKWSLADSRIIRGLVWDLYSGILKY